MKRRLIATGFLCLLAGCANYPGQRTKAEWNAPPAAEQQRLLTARGREAAEQNGHSNSSRRECGRERKKPNVDPGLRPSDVVTVGMMQHRLRFRNKPLPPQIQFPSNKASHALARQPTFDEALGLRAMILNQTGKTAESMKLLKEGVASNPQSLALRTQSLALRTQLLSFHAMAGNSDFARRKLAEIAKSKHAAAGQIVAKLAGWFK